MKKKKLERKLRRLEKCLRITEVNKKENDTKIPGIRYYATKEEIVEGIQENHRYQFAKLEKRIRKLEMSMELSVSLLSVLMDHIDMKRHRKILTREEMLSRGGIDAILEEKKKEIEEIKKLAQKEGIDYQMAIFRYQYIKRQDECRASIKELEKMWEVKNGI